MARPTKLDDQLIDTITANLRTGHYVETAAALSGISKQSLYSWLKLGRRCLDTGTPTAKLKAHEARCIRFLDAVEKAQAEALDRDLLRHAAMARGGLERVIVTEKVVGNQVVERTTRTESLAPDARALEWRMERRHPQLFGRQQRVELTGPDGGPLELTVEERASALAEQAALFLEGAAAQRDTVAPIDQD